MRVLIVRSKEVSPDSWRDYHGRGIMAVCDNATVMWSETEELHLDYIDGLKHQGIAYIESVDGNNYRVYNSSFNSILSDDTESA